MMPSLFEIAYLAQVDDRGLPLPIALSQRPQGQDGLRARVSSSVAAGPIALSG